MFSHWQKTRCKKQSQRGKRDSNVFLSLLAVFMLRFVRSNTHTFREFWTLHIVWSRERRHTDHSNRSKSYVLLRKERLIPHVTQTDLVQIHNCLGFKYFSALKLIWCIERFWKRTNPSFWSSCVVLIAPGNRVQKIIWIQNNEVTVIKWFRSGLVQMCPEKKCYSRTPDCVFCCRVRRASFIFKLDDCKILSTKQIKCFRIHLGQYEVISKYV